jgi:hypothetical protein
MTSDSGCDFLSEDRQLQVGRAVTAYWCKEGFYYQGEGVIVQLARDKVSVQLQQQVAWSDDFTAGRIICLPRISDSSHWSASNCVRLPKKHPLAG